MIKISEKDFLFILINVVGFMAWVSYQFLDFVASQAQIMAAADPQYATVEVGFAMLRMTSYLFMVMIGAVCISCDLWWGYRLWRIERQAYWRENL